MRIRLAWLGVGAALVASACGSDGPDPSTLCEGVEEPCTGFLPEASSQEDILRAFVTADDGATLVFGEGTFALDRELSLDAQNVTIRGRGMGETVLDFSEQSTGHGIFVESPGDNFLIEDVTIRNPRQNGIEVRGTKGIVFRRIEVEWTADPSEFDPDDLDGDPEEVVDDSPFGRYGIYPTSCDHVLVEHSVVRRASDAGVYVGSCADAVLRFNTAEENVAGFQVENTLRADVYGNTGTNNSLGMLVHDLPAQPVHANGDQTRVFDNEFVDNNFINFSLPADLTTNIPVGTGMVVLSRSQVEVYDNRFADNDSVNLAIVAYHMLSLDFPTDNGFDPHPGNVFVHDNTFEGGGGAPEANRRGRLIQMGAFLDLIREEDGFDGRVPDIVYDGILDPDVEAGAPEEWAANPMRICLGEEPDGSFVNLQVDLANLEGPDIPALLEDLSQDVEPFRCALGSEAGFPLPAVELDLWPEADYDPAEE